jgi:MFS family permease
LSAPKPSRFVPPPGPPRVLAAAQLISTLGDGAYYVTAALYFTRVVGLSPIHLGAGLTAAWAVALVAGVPLGHAADRFGPRGTAAALTAVAGLSCFSYLFIRSFPLFVAAAAVYAVSTRGAIAARQAALAGLVPEEKRTETRAYIQTTYNAGLALGAAIGGLALHFDTREAYLSVFAFNAVSFLLAATVLRTRLPAVPARPAADGHGPALTVLRDRPYALISLLNLVLVLHVPLIDVALPLWVVRHTDAPRSVIAAIFLLNTVAVVLFQVRVARGVTSVASATRYVRYAGVILLAGCVAFAASAAGSSKWLAVGFLLLAAGLQAAAEMAQFPGTWELSFALAPPDKHGQYQGFFGSGMTAAEMIGPLLLTTLVVTWGAPGWFVLGALFALAGFAMQPAVRWAERTRAVDRATPSVEAALASATEGPSSA